MTRTAAAAREVREFVGAQSEANTRLTMEIVLLEQALAGTSDALNAAMGHMTELERENDKLRSMVRDLSTMRGRSTMEVGK